MEHRGKEITGLPENAYRKLREGETFTPVIPPGKIVPELTPYSLSWGLIYAVVFSAAAAYLGLKIGQVFEAAIPIAILAVGLSVMLKKKDSLSQNVIIQSIGAASGLVVAGAIFTIPGLYILGIEASFLQVFLASVFGGMLGMLFLIPFRRFFVKDMHGEFPFPEATATTEVLVAGEAGGEQARVLVLAAAVGGAYDFLTSGLGLWKEVVSTAAVRTTAWGGYFYEQMKLELRINIGAAVTGLGYIVGLRYAAVIAAGSFLSWWVLVPLVFMIGQNVPQPFMTQGGLTIGQMTPLQIFYDYVRHVGIGGIAAAGIIGIIKSRKIIFGAFRLALSEISGGRAGGPEVEQVERTQQDMRMKWVMTLILGTLLAVFLFFYIGVVELNLLHAVVGLLIVGFIAFLFTTVAARAIAIVGTNPVSGMTLMTLILSSVILVNVGLSGKAGILAALLIGGVVCTALSMAGGAITDLKIGYWLGTTPRTQQWCKLLGTLVSAAAVGLVILLLYKTYGFGPGGLEAPQASAMAAVIEPLMTGQPAPWLAYLAGIFMAIVLEMIGVPPLAFALGMYLPLHLNTPILAGGLIAHLVSTRSKDEALNNARREKGTLIASGFIAGGAIMGVVAALINFAGKQLVSDDWSLIAWAGMEAWEASDASQLVGFAMFLVLLAYMAWDSLRAKKKS